MEFQQIIEIHEKEKELKIELQKTLEKKKNEFNLIDQYYKDKLEELKKRLEKFAQEKENQIKARVENEIENIENETKNIIKKLDTINTDLINKAIEYVKEEFFKE